MSEDTEEQIRELLGTEAGRQTLRARAYLQLGRAYAQALANDDYKAACAALDQQAKVAWLYAPTARAGARAGAEDLSLLSDEELAERGAKAAESLLAGREAP